MGLQTRASTEIVRVLDDIHWETDIFYTDGLTFSMQFSLNVGQAREDGVIYSALQVSL